MKMLEEIVDQKSLFKRLHPYLESKKESLKDKVTQSRNIVLFGTGASLNACIASNFAFVEFQKKKPIIIPASDASFYMDTLYGDDLIIVVSQSGDSFETKMICDLLKERNFDFIGITNNEKSTLAKKASETILLQANNEISSATKTYTATIYVLFYLATISSATSIFDEIDNVVNEILSTTYDTKQIVDECAKRKYMYVLSDSINYSTARATALLLKEKDLILAEPMTLSEFRHGAVEVVKEDFLCFIIVSDVRYQKEFLKHLSFLKSINATIVCISSYDIDQTDNMFHLKVPSIKTSVFSPIPMILLAQLLSVDIANALNLDVDKFVYLNKVVDVY